MLDPKFMKQQCLSGLKIVLCGNVAGVAIAFFLDKLDKDVSWKLLAILSALAGMAVIIISSLWLIKIFKQRKEDLIIDDFDKLRRLCPTEVLEICSKATAGPWVPFENEDGTGQIVIDGVCIPLPSYSDALFLSVAREWLPRLTNDKLKFEERHTELSRENWQLIEKLESIKKMARS